MRKIVLSLHLLLFLFFSVAFESNVLAQQTFTTFQSADLVIGQPDFTSVSASCTQEGVFGPAYVAISSKGVLAVANQRSGGVKLWTKSITENGQPADVIVGNYSFTSCGGGISQSMMNVTNGVAFSPDGNKLLVADAGNNRVLIWNSIPTTNGQPADIVLGQNNFATNLSGTDANKFNHPVGVYVSADGRLIVSDMRNHRVLIWNKIPTTNNVPADVVVGQPDFVTSTSGNTANKMMEPWGVWVSPDGKLLVADVNNHRVLVFNSIPTTNGAHANVVIGQNGFGLTTSGTSASLFNMPLGVAVSPQGQLAIGEFGNNRVLIYNSIPTTNGASANLVLGQRDFNSGSSFSPNDLPTSQNMSRVYNVSYDLNGRLFVTGRDMERVMVFGNIPTQSADLGINITALSSSLCNGNDVQFDITINNNGPDDASDVYVTANLPANFSLTSASSSAGSYSIGSSNWKINSLVNGASATLTLKGTVNTSISQTITAYTNITASNQLDEVMNNNAASVDVVISDGTIPTGGALTGPATAFRGQTVTYSFTGAADATKYNWSVTGGENIIQNGNEISFTMGNTNAVVSVQPANDNCSGAVFTQTVTYVPSSITTGAITPNTYCQGASINVPFTTVGYYSSGNTFTAQLSDATGSFAAPVNIGSVAASASGNIAATIPANATAGAGYKIRVVSDNPVITSTDNGSAITINTIPALPTITASGNTLTSSANTGNQWYLNNDAIAGATNQNYQVQASGLYTVRVTQGNCQNTSVPYNFVATRIDGPGIWNNEVRIYPNPVTTTLNIKNQNARRLQWQLLDINGKEVQSGRLTSSQGTINVQSHASGTYQLRLMDEKTKETTTQTIIKL